MKAYSLIILLLLGGILQTLGQNFRPFNQGRKYLYKNGNGFIKTSGIDSVTPKNNGDTILWITPIIRPIFSGYPNCVVPSGASWSGRNIILHPDRSFLLHSLNGDSILIKPSSKTAEKWLAWLGPENDSAFAYINRISTHSFEGEEDSLLQILFNIPDHFKKDTFEIQLSKKYGIFSMMDMASFPDIFYPIDVFPFMDNNVTLVGLTNPQIGIQDLRWEDIYNYRPGDILHTRFYSLYGYPDSKVYTLEERKKILTSSVSGSDSLGYTVEREVKINFLEHGISRDTSYKTISTEIYIKNDLLNFPSGVPISFGSESFTWWDLQWEGNVLVKTDNQEVTQFMLTEDSCYTPLMVDGPFTAYKYLEGLGGPYYNACGFLDPEQSLYELVYYKKSDQEWGTPLDFVVESPQIRQSPVTLVAADDRKLLLQGGGLEMIPCHLLLIDLQGRILMNRRINSVSIPIPEQIASGQLLLYRLVWNNGCVVQGKVLLP